MAIQSAINFRGIDIPAAYHRIEAEHKRKDIGRIQCVVATYASAEACENKAQPLNMIAVEMAYNPDQTVAMSYAHLKNLPEFAGAVDV